MKSWRPDRVGFTHLNNQIYVKVTFRKLLHEMRCGRVMELLDLNINLSSVPTDIALGGQCCGQFAVTRERILAIPRDWFILARKLVYEGQCCNCFEYIWHFIFGEPAIMPPGATSTAKGHFKVHKTDGRSPGRVRIDEEEKLAIKLKQEEKLKQKQEEKLKQKQEEKLKHAAMLSDAKKKQS